MDRHYGCSSYFPGGQGLGRKPQSLGYRGRADLQHRAAVVFLGGAVDPHCGLVQLDRLLLW
jgi:hypothetical protein